MAVPFLVTAAPTFPQGSTVKAYLRRNWAGEPPLPGDTPRATVSATSSAVDSHGFAEFSGLLAATAYYLGAEVSGVWRWKSCTTQDDGGGATDLTALEASVAALEASLSGLGSIYVRLVEAGAEVTVTGNVVLTEAAIAQVHVLTMKASAQVTLPKAIKWTSFTVVTVQDGSGNRVPTWHSPTGSVRWPGGAVPTASVTAGAIDVWNFVCWDGVHWDGAPPMLAMA